MRRREERQVEVRGMMFLEARSFDFRTLMQVIDGRGGAVYDCQVNDTGQWSLPCTSLWMRGADVWAKARSLTSM